MLEIDIRISGEICMQEIDIPGFGLVRPEHLVSDFTGTLSFDGALLPEVKELLNRIALIVKVHVVTADTFGTARAALEGVDCALTILTGEDVDVQKEWYVRDLGADGVIAIGNGNNDRLMLKMARVGIAVTEKEGCAVAALSNADIHVNSISGGLGLLLNPNRLKASLRT